LEDRDVYGVPEGNKRVSQLSTVAPSVPVK